MLANIVLSYSYKYFLYVVGMDSLVQIACGGAPTATVSAAFFCYIYNTVGIGAHSPRSIVGTFVSPNIYHARICKIINSYIARKIFGTGIQTGNPIVTSC